MLLTLIETFDKNSRIIEEHITWIIREIFKENNGRVLTKIYVEPTPYVGTCALGSSVESAVATLGDTLLLLRGLCYWLLLLECVSKPSTGGTFTVSRRTSQFELV